MAELNERLAGCYIRHRKEEVLEELPEKEVISVLLDPTEIPQGMTELEHTPDVRKLKELFRKDKAEKAANFARTSPDLSRLRRLTGLAKAPAAVQYINNVIDGGCKKLVVFRHHREVGEVLEQELQHHGAVGITAGQTAEQRQICIDRFQNDPDTKVCVASLGAASTAITLHAASDAIFVESDWSPATNIQAANRIHRIGQRRHVLIRFLALPDSVDEVIQRVVAEKVRVTDKLLPSGGA